MKLYYFYTLKELWDGLGKIKMYYGMPRVKKQLLGKSSIKFQRLKLCSINWSLFLFHLFIHKDDGEKLRKDIKITGFSQHMKTTGYSPAWGDVRVIYIENNWKKRKFKEAARITSHNKEQLMNKEEERKTISNL